jgi:hypothetical protein
VVGLSDVDVDVDVGPPLRRVSRLIANRVGMRIILSALRLSVAEAANSTSHTHLLDMHLKTFNTVQRKGK